MKALGITVPLPQLGRAAEMDRITAAFAVLLTAAFGTLRHVTSAQPSSVFDATRISISKLSRRIHEYVA